MIVVVLSFSERRSNVNSGKFDFPTYNKSAADDVENILATLMEMSINKGTINWNKIENINAKGEIACFEQFLLFSQCFQKSSAEEASKSVYLWERVQIHFFPQCFQKLSTTMISKIITYSYNEFLNYLDFLIQFLDISSLCNAYVRWCNNILFRLSFIRGKETEESWYGKLKLNGMTIYKIILNEFSLRLIN